MCSSDPISRWPSSPAANESSGLPSHTGLDGEVVGSPVGDDDAGVAVGAKDDVLGLWVSPELDGDPVGSEDGLEVVGEAVGTAVVGNVVGATVGSVVGGLVAGDVVGDTVAQTRSRS